MDGGTVRVRLWRGGADGALRDYDVPRRPSQTVLDVVTHMQRHVDPDARLPLSRAAWACADRAR